MTILNLPLELTQNVVLHLSFREALNLKKSCKTLNRFPVELWTGSNEVESQALLSKILKFKRIKISSLILDHLFKSITAISLPILFNHISVPYNLWQDLSEPGRWERIEYRTKRFLNKFGKNMNSLAQSQSNLFSNLSIDQQEHLAIEALEGDYRHIALQIFNSDFELFNNHSEKIKEQIIKIVVEENYHDLLETILRNSTDLVKTLIKTAEFTLKYQKTEILKFILQLFKADFEKIPCFTFPYPQIQIILIIIKTLCYLKGEDLALNTFYNRLVTFITNAQLLLLEPEQVTLAFASGSINGLKVLKKAVSYSSFHLNYDQMDDLITLFAQNCCIEHLHFGWSHPRLNFQAWKAQVLKAGFSPKDLPTE